MNVYTIHVIMWAGAALLSGILLVLVPAKLLRKITSPFTFSSKGIRKIRRWHTTTDTLGNILETLCVIYCFTWPFVPDALLWYGLILAFTLLCTISRCAIIALKQTKGYPGAEIRIVMVCLWMVGIIGFGAAGGFFNGRIFDLPVHTLAQKARTGTLFDDLFYYLSDPGLFHYLLESVLMVIPICTLWNQFKHMRLERTYKSINLFFFLCKMAVICAILIGGGWLGFDALNTIWHFEPATAWYAPGTVNTL